MDCVEKCGGHVDTTTRVSVRTGCSSSGSAYPCGKCGRLHWHDGSGVNNRSDAKAFWKDGHLVNRDGKGNETVIG